MDCATFIVLNYQPKNIPRSWVGLMRTLLKFLVASLSIATLAVLSATSAQAISFRTLPAQNTLYAFDCDSNPFGEILSVDVSTFAGTLVAGSGSADSKYQCAFQGAFNPTNGDVYWLSAAGSITTYLMKANLTTGVSTVMGQIKLNGTPVQAQAIAIGADGIARATVATQPAEVTHTLYSLDLTSGALTNPVTITGSNVTSIFYSFAFNPKDSQFYLYSRAGNRILKVNVSTGVTTDACVFSTPYFRIKGFSFDQDGIAWGADITGGGGSIDVSQSDCAPQAVAALKLNGTDWYSESPLVTYPITPPAPAPAPSDDTASPTLAKTGVDGSSLLTIATVALLAGGGVLFGARRRVQRNK
jgi:LPXTG-motif cell wall-anchored protein